MISYFTVLSATVNTCFSEHFSIHVNNGFDLFLFPFAVPEAEHSRDRSARPTQRTNTVSVS
jgi:hypothetical protein